MKSGATQTVVATRRNEKSSGGQASVLSTAALRSQNGAAESSDPVGRHGSEANPGWSLAWSRRRQEKVFRQRPDHD